MKLFLYNIHYSNNPLVYLWLEMFTTIKLGYDQFRLQPTLGRKACYDQVESQPSFGR